jgi:hypothetical protein
MAKIYEFPHSRVGGETEVLKTHTSKKEYIARRVGIVAGLGVLGVAVYTAYDKLANPYELKRSDRVKLQHVLQPTAVKVGKLAMAPGNVETITQGSGPKGTVEVDAEVITGQVHYQIIADMEKLRGKPDAESTFKVVITREKPVINQPRVIRIENRDPSEHSNGKVWYGNVSLTLPWKGGKLPFNQDTHIDDPTDKGSVDWAVSTAQSEVSFINEILAGKPAQ